MLYKVIKNIVQHVQSFQFHYTTAVVSCTIRTMLYTILYTRSAPAYPAPLLLRPAGPACALCINACPGHHNHADYIIAVLRAPSPRAGAPALPAGAPTRPPSAPAITRQRRNSGGVLGQNCFFIYRCTAASCPAAKAAVPAMVQIASSGGSSRNLASAPG